MKFIKNIIHKLINKEKKLLGRWNLEYCSNKIDNKIDLANEDHCGPCGQYVLEKANKEVNKIKELNIKNV
jgi:hypothetical protein